MLKWFEDTWLAFVAWIGVLWTDLTNFLTDLPINILEGVLMAFASVINAIPVPQFIQTNGLSGVISALPDSVQYLLSATGFVQALAVLGAGFLFRVMRKFVTLFQW